MRATRFIEMNTLYCTADCMLDQHPGNRCDNPPNCLAELTNVTKEYWLL